MSVVWEGFEQVSSDDHQMSVARDKSPGLMSGGMVGPQVWYLGREVHYLFHDACDVLIPPPQENDRHLWNITFLQLRSRAVERSSLWLYKRCSQISVPVFWSIRVPSIVHCLQHAHSICCIISTDNSKRALSLDMKPSNRTPIRAF